MRSPKEFAAGHVPGATNVPLFSDEERAIIGTLYVNSGRNVAMEKGLEFVGPKMAGFVRTTNQILAEGSSEVTDSSEPGSDFTAYVHCWRGGMRSQSFAWLLDMAGIKVRVLEGGYKAFRRMAQRQIGRRHRMVVLSGLTGAGKTNFLELLREAGEQIVDLEGLANHRGSSFGAIGLGQQPTTEQFENRLFAAVQALDPKRRFWVEDEGSRLGRVVVPSRFVKQIRRSSAVFLDVAKEKRLDILLEEYGDLDHEELIDATRGIQKRLGGQNMIDAIKAIEAGDLRTAAEISLTYYDRSYLKGMSELPRASTLNLSTDGMCDADVVAKLIDAADEIENAAEPASVVSD